MARRRPSSRFLSKPKALSHFPSKNRPLGRFPRAHRRLRYARSGRHWGNRQFVVRDRCHLCSENLIHVDGPFGLWLPSQSAVTRRTSDPVEPRPTHFLTVARSMPLVHRQLDSRRRVSLALVAVARRKSRLRTGHSIPLRQRHNS